jgi:chemotaxis protein methyltransferase CheR
MSALSPQLFAIFAFLVEESSGLHYGDGDHELFGAKLSAHAEDQGHGALIDYYYRLRYDDPGGELKRQLIEALVVRETYFFRELEPLEQLVDVCARAIELRGRSRVWSAACSSGEEPLTMAMLLAERGLLDRVEVVGTDLSAESITRARTGRHPRRALRDRQPAVLAQRYLDATTTGVAVVPRIREAVRFEVLNLLDAAAISTLGMFDVILCRNVLIYFADDLVAQVVGRLTAQLEPDGLLAVGVSESLLRFGTALVCEERGGSFFYRVAR